MADATALFRSEALARFRWVRRDRGAALYIAREPRGGAEAGSLLDAREAGGAWFLSPSEEGARKLSALLPPCADSAMEQFADGTFSVEDLSLLAEGCKLMEAPSPGDWERYMAAVHRRAAALLREKRQGEGGALYVCARLAEALASRE